VDNDLQRIIQSATFQMKQRELRLVQVYGKRQQKTLVSVIMPTRNRRFIIQRAIDSVIAQSYENFQLIILDDGSTDGTGDYVLGEYGGEPRIRYIYREHRGVSYARNSALENAEGQMIAYLDSDNQWGVNYLLVMVNALEDCPDTYCAYCGIRVINAIRQARFTRLVSYDRKSLLERNYIDINIFVHRKNVFERYGGFKHEIAPLEDWELILRYTQEQTPLVVECCLANYYISKDIDHQTIICDADSSYHKIRAWYRK
jgi:glycosyltransferase involved in cell wall biosynthesis